TSSDKVGRALAHMLAIQGKDRLHRFVIQPFLQGPEFGVDIVCPLGGPSRVAGVLAREKLGMRAGESNRAVTVEPDDFWPLGDRIVQVIHPQGLIDVDVVHTDDFGMQVLDVNLRFGGGYPFNHAAGADVPAYYLTQHLGLPTPARWATYRAGVVG